MVSGSDMVGRETLQEQKKKKENIWCRTRKAILIFWPATDRKKNTRKKRKHLLLSGSMQIYPHDST